MEEVPKATTSTCQSRSCREVYDQHGLLLLGGRQIGLCHPDRIAMRAVRLRAWCNATIKTLRRAARNQYVDGAMAQEDGD